MWYWYTDIIYVYTTDDVGLLLGEAVLDMILDWIYHARIHVSIYTKTETLPQSNLKFYNSIIVFFSKLLSQSKTDVESAKWKTEIYKMFDV